MGMKPFTVAYKYGGKTYSENISAESVEDAEARVEAMYRTMDVGELVAQIDNPTQDRISRLMNKLGWTDA